MASMTASSSCSLTHIRSSLRHSARAGRCGQTLIRHCQSQAAESTQTLNPPLDLQVPAASPPLTGFQLNSAATTLHSSHPTPAAHQSRLLLASAACISLPFVALVPEASALAVHVEPANALSLPTWAIHFSSVAEWVSVWGSICGHLPGQGPHCFPAPTQVTAMVLMVYYADATGNKLWKGMAWAMVPALGGAMCACTWHFFYNSPG